MRVPGAGVEPAWPKPQDFKSCVYTNSTILAGTYIYGHLRCIFGIMLKERETGLEPATPTLAKVVLYQLSYSRLCMIQVDSIINLIKHSLPSKCSFSY